jgi:sulfate transport system substrate-binding protein
MKSNPLKTLINVKSSFKPSPLKASALVAGLGLTMAIPVFAVNFSNPSAQSAPNSSLISQAKPKLELTLVSYAVTSDAYSKIIPAFVEKWKKEKKQDITFRQSYGGSGSQTRAVIDGLEADVVQLALEGDVSKIEKAGLIDPGWQKEAPNNAIVTKSVVAIATRDGNPKKIKTWTDLDNPGVKTITANPKTSGGARWNFLGLWGSVTQTGGSEEKAKQFVTLVYKQVPVLPKDARESSDVFFKQGQGDVLLNYENELILATKKGEKNDYVVPSVNISIDAPVAVVDKVVAKKGTKEVAEAFVQYLYSPEAQRIFVESGFRPVNPVVAKESANKFPKVAKLFTVGDFGGWEAINKKFFADGAIFDQVTK